MAKKVNTDVIAYLAAARSLIKTQPDMARKKVLKARKIAMRKTIRLPRAIKMEFCPACKSPLDYSSAKVRVRSTRVIIHCPHCKHMQKFGGPAKKKH